MAAFVIDEDLPSLIAERLRELGHDAVSIREAGLESTPDSGVFQFAQERHASLISADLGFGSVVTYPVGTHFGIVITRLPEARRDVIVARVLEALSGDTGDLFGCLMIVQRRRTRIRRP